MRLFSCDCMYFINKIQDEVIYGVGGVIVLRQELY